MSKRILIVGGGLVGSLLAVMMAKRGHSVRVYERRPDPRKNLIDGGRSINLVVSHRGWTALRAAGLEQRVRDITVPVYGRMMHDREGGLNYQQYSALKKAIHSVSRGQLNEELLSAAEEFHNVEVLFDHRLNRIDLDKGECSFSTSNGVESFDSADLIVGADGAFSSVRKRMLGTRMSYAQHFIEHDYKEMLIPPAPDGTPQLDPQALHIWPRRSFMMMGLANLDGGFTGTLFWPHEGANSFSSLTTEAAVNKFFKQEFPDAVPLIPDLVQQYFDNPVSSLITVHCDPWHYKDKVLLIGDAAHAIVPFYGEGMNCGLEDCRVLNDIMEKYGDDFGTVLQKYSEQRVVNGHAIAELSMRNFVEMRDSVADEKFLLRKKIEANLFLNNPEKWMPLYSQVKFSDIPYSEALSEGQRQDKVMERILQLPDLGARWKDPDIQMQALEMLANTA